MTVEQPLKTLMVIWGVPGTGKSTFARWLVEHHGYVHAATDDGADINEATVTSQSGKPVVIEWGVYVEPGSIATVRAWRSLGAEAWWFDGNRLAAYAAWRRENERARRNFRDDKWDQVVGPINRNWSLIEQFFGKARILRTIEKGSGQVPPETIYAQMLEVIGSESV